LEEQKQVNPKKKYLPLSFTSGFFLMFGSELILGWLDLTRIGLNPYSGNTFLLFGEIGFASLVAIFAILASVLKFKFRYQNVWKFLVGGVVGTIIIGLLVVGLILLVAIGLALVSGCPAC
jgi:hypothetical protein